jgi:hypothetical protein
LPSAPTTLLKLHAPNAEMLHAAAACSGLPAHLTGLNCFLDAPALAAGGDAARRVAVHVCALPWLQRAPARNFSLTTMPLSDCVSRAAAAASAEWLYLRSVGVDARRQPARFERDYPDAAARLTLPACALPLGGAERLHSSVLRLASPGLCLWLHYDALDNVLLQAGGAAKRVLLFPPSAAGGLYLSGSSSRIPTELLDDPGRAAAAGFPLYAAARARALALRLVPGEGLFIPANWAHFVAVEGSGQPSVALNLFWRADGDDTPPPERDVYGNADPPAALRALAAAEEAAGALLTLPPRARAFFAARCMALVEEAAALG